MCFLNSFVLFLIDDCRIRLFLGVLKLRREQLNIIQFWGFYYYIFSLSGFWDQISRGNKSQLLISSFDARVHCVVAMLWNWSQLTGCYIILGWGKKWKFTYQWQPHGVQAQKILYRNIEALSNSEKLILASCQVAVVRANGVLFCSEKEMKDWGISEGRLDHMKSWQALLAWLAWLAVFNAQTTVNVSVFSCRQRNVGKNEKKS